MFYPKPPNGPQDSYAYGQILELARYIESGGLDRLSLIPANAAPKKPRDGDIVYADGANWNPGSGTGLYQFRTGSWEFVG